MPHMQDTKQLRQAMHTAVSVPRVPTFSSLVGALKMGGYQIVPYDLWEDVGNLVRIEDMGEVADINDRPTVGGWALYSNHERSQPHLEFQDRIANDEDRDSTWIIPVNELECIVHADEYYDDFIEIYRLVFRGTESEMRKAVQDLFVALVQNQ